MVAACVLYPTQILNVYWQLKFLNCDRIFGTLFCRAFSCCGKLQTTWPKPRLGTVFQNFLAENLLSFMKVELTCVECFEVAFTLLFLILNFESYFLLFTP